MTTSRSYVHSERIAMDGGTHYNRTVVVAPKGSRAQRATLQLPRLALLANDGQEEEVLLCAIHSKERGDKMLWPSGNRSR